MKKGCLYPIIVFFVIAIIITIVATSFEKDMEADQFVLADTADYYIQFDFANKTNLFFKAENKSENQYAIEITDVTADGEEVGSLDGLDGAELVSTNVEETLEGNGSDSWDENGFGTFLINKELLKAKSSSDSVSFSHKQSGADFTTQKIEGIFNIYKINLENGTYEKVQSYPFTIEAGAIGTGKMS